MSSDSEESNPQSMLVKMQKKIASKFASRSTAKMFSDKLSSRIVDNLYKILRNYTGSKHTANKILKYVITISVKLHILQQNNVFNENDKTKIENLTEVISKAARYFIELNNPKIKNKNVSKLFQTLNEIQIIIENLSKNHLKEKSKSKIDFCVSILVDKKFLETLFQNDDLYKNYVDEINDDLIYLLDRQIL